MDDERRKPCCCGSASPAKTPSCGLEQAGAAAATGPWIVGSVATPVGEVPRVASALDWPDRIGTAMVRFNIRRMRYAIRPGLYAVGQPTSESPVLVSANYKLSFDRLRSQLGNLDAWLLVLDTRGINVWCAAGKGTFGTDELLRQIEAVRLPEVVVHQRLILPQLGAPGVAAHEVTKRSGFRVVYGPVRARDLPAFLAAEMKAVPEMRRVRFPLVDRLVLVPVELALVAKWAIAAAICLFLFSGLRPGGFSWERMLAGGVAAAGLWLAVCLACVVLGAALLPWLPGRAFSLKGLWLGVVMAAPLAAWGWLHPGVLASRASLVGWLLLIPAVSSFLVMNFTGATPYTSLSGVRKEVRIAGPIQLAAATLGLALWLIGRFLG